MGVLRIGSLSTTPALLVMLTQITALVTNQRAAGAWLAFVTAQADRVTIREHYHHSATVCFCIGLYLKEGPGRRVIKEVV